MRKVYICHPFGGSRENYAAVTQICRALAESDPDIMPVSPVHAFSYLDDAIHREVALKYCLELVGMCDELWVYGDWRNSTGCKAEIAYAKKREIRVLEKTPPCPTVGCNNELQDRGCAWYCNKCGYRVWKGFYKKEVG